MVTAEQKQALKNRLIDSLKEEKDIKRVVTFGSFPNSEDPVDMDVAVFQDSSEGYIELAMRYRKLTRAISRTIPVDIFPVRSDAEGASVLPELENGEFVYER